MERVDSVTLRHLLPVVAQAPAMRGLLSQLAQQTPHLVVADLPNAARPAVIAAAIGAHRGQVLVVTARDDRADLITTEINEYLPPARRARRWMTPETLPYEQLPFDLVAATHRVALLDQIAQDAEGVVVTAQRGLTHLVVGPEDLGTHRGRLRVGDRLDASALLTWAVTMGYQVSPLVQEPGTIARRGGIVDLFPPAAELPVRIDLFGDEIESIRTFNPSTQRSDRALSELTLLPPSDLPLWRLAEIAGHVGSLSISSLRPEVQDEWERTITRMAAGGLPPSLDLFAPFLLADKPTILSHLQHPTLLILDEPSAIERAAVHLDGYAQELVDGFVANGELPPGLPQPFASWPEIAPRLASMQRFDLGLPDDRTPSTSVDDVTEAPVYAGRLTRVVEDIAGRLQQGWKVAIATDQVERITDIFEENDIFPVREKRRDDGDPSPIPAGMLDIRASDMSGGWMVEGEKLLLLTDLELFGFRKQPRRGGRKLFAENAAFAASLTPGEFVVHIDHGIGKFMGLQRVDTSGVEREYLLLEYAKGDKLYVPVDQSDRVTRYSGGGVDPEVTKLGSGEWTRAKQRVRKAVREMAFELIQLYAARDQAVTDPLGPDSHWDLELEESFPYTETTDQQRAIDDVKHDLETPKPMDRLVCGDVGYGKTEVALRAAFKAVNGGRQVAILVPTTVLALQHFQTFTQRLAAFPVRVEMLSRLRTKGQQTQIVEGLADGSVDIVIGTHRLVQRDVRFKQLGLVVIDEEQRFGVRQKEFLKTLRTEVDVLTMSATPIPRTLHLSLAGIRDISVIDTAPQARLPIRTFVTEFSDTLIREAILRELERGGQVYVVHNRVHSIDHLVHHLRELVPEARFGVGHGQMDEDVLEEVILSFVRHEYDVLVCTTIIESGIDIPNVNTIVIDHADRLGLTQLYQLRGRVGRSSNRAYAYLLTRPSKALSAEANARLEAIQEATELGAGMRVAMRDMEIRGAGNILGAEQSGHIGEVGFDLYIRLLSQAVEEVKAGRPFEEKTPVTLDLPLTALLPASYIADVELRLNTYRRVADVHSERELHDARLELEDRFGPIPEEVERLFALIALRLRCVELGIESMVEREREIVIRPVTTRLLNAIGLGRRIGPALKLTPNSVRLRLPDLSIPWQEAIDVILDEIEAHHVPEEPAFPEAYSSRR